MAAKTWCGHVHIPTGAPGTDLRGVQLEIFFELSYQAQEIRCQQRNTEILKKILPNSFNQKLIQVLTGQEIKKHKQTENLSKKTLHRIMSIKSKVLSNKVKIILNLQSRLSCFKMILSK